ncbi:type II secretion system protein GspD [Pseudoduganella sp. R-34]|uniref:type II secretion system protein GspD n=1 Tax=Pseudoduganella sp. R-34 TaxID=3404062 RepID=UPI003CF48618
MKLKIVAIAALAMVSGCTSPALKKEAASMQNDVLSRVQAMNSQLPKGDMGKVTGSAEYADALAQEQMKRPVMRRANSTYIGSRTVPVSSDDRLPSVFREDFSWTTDDIKAARSVSLNTVANRVFNATHIPVRIQSDVGTVAVNAIPTTKVAVAPGEPLQEMAIAPAVSPLMLDNADLKYKGPLVGFLNHLTDRLGLAWEYRDGTVVIMRYMTESFEVSAFIGKSKYDMNSGVTGSGQTTGSQSTDSKLTVNDDGTTDAFTSLEKTVKQIVSGVPGSEVIRADGSKQLIVKSSKEMLAQVRDFITGENALMQKQALIQFDIYSVQTSEQDERGANWTVLFNSLSQIYGVSSSSPTTLTGINAGNIGVKVLEGNSDASQRFANTQAFVNMLKQSGTSVQHRTIPMMAMNGTWARKSRLSTESFISETTPGASSAVGAGAPGIKTDKVTTGDQFQVLPQIQKNNTVLLKFGLSLSDLLGLTDVTSGQGANQQKVQTTKVSANGEQTSLVMKPGQVFSVTGLSRDVSTGDKRSLSEDTPILFGGSRKVGIVREHFIIFIRTVVI